MLGDPTADHEIETLAREVGTSARTLSRLFSSETQLSFKSWCQRARIAAAIERLSTEANVSVKQLASDLGYASVPAFSHAFRQVTGKTPTEFAGKGRERGLLSSRSMTYFTYRSRTLDCDRLCPKSHVRFRADLDSTCPT